MMQQLFEAFHRLRTVDHAGTGANKIPIGFPSTAEQKGAHMRITSQLCHVRAIDFAPPARVSLGDFSI